MIISMFLIEELWAPEHEVDVREIQPLQSDTQHNA
jgi:hypothetical protein